MEVTLSAVEPPPDGGWRFVAATLANGGGGSGSPRRAERPQLTLLIGSSHALATVLPVQETANRARADRGGLMVAFDVTWSP